MYKFGMAEDDSTYVYTEDVSETAKPSTPVTKGTLRMSNMSTPIMKPSVKQQRKIKPLPNRHLRTVIIWSYRRSWIPIARARHTGNHCML